MSDLIVIGYPDEKTAQNVWEELVKLERDYLVDLEDAAIIRRDQKGKLQRPVLGSPDRAALPVPARPTGRRRGRHHGSRARRRREPRHQGRL